MNQISNYRDIIKQYFKEKQFSIPHDEFLDRIVSGETTRDINEALADERMTMTECIEMIKRDFPEELHGIAQAIGRGSELPDPDAYIRESNIRSANRDFGMELPFELLPGIPEGFSFDAFVKKRMPPTVKKAWSAALAWGQGDPALQDSKPILVLAGAPGVGKTHLAAAAAWALAGAGKEIAFRTESQIMADIRSSFNRHDTEDVIAS
jgi:chromosomal replication initiation ATPase DnaA